MDIYVTATTSELLLLLFFKFYALYALLLHVCLRIDWQANKKSVTIGKLYGFSPPATCCQQQVCAFLAFGQQLLPP